MSNGNHKKYILLAYLKQIKERFEENEIYPYLSDLIEHYRSLIQLKENKDKLNKKELTHIDLHKLELVYTPLNEDLLEEVTSLVEWPVVLTAQFEKDFLKVPAEALVYTMKGDQK